MKYKYIWLCERQGKVEKGIKLKRNSK